MKQPFIVQLSMAIPQSWIFFWNIDVILVLRIAGAKQPWIWQLSTEGTQLKSLKLRWKCTTDVLYVCLITDWKRLSCWWGCIPHWYSTCSGQWKVLCFLTRLFIWLVETATSKYILFTAQFKVILLCQQLYRVHRGCFFLLFVYLGTMVCVHQQANFSETPINYHVIVSKATRSHFAIAHCWIRCCIILTWAYINEFLVECLPHLYQWNGQMYALLTDDAYCWPVYRDD